MVEIKVREVMSKNPLFVESSMNLWEAVKAMVQRGISTMIVVDNNVPVGILTDRDIVVKVVARGLDPTEVKVFDIMTKPIVVINADDTLERAATLMAKKKIRKLPVIENNKIIGLLSENDIVRIAPTILEIIEEKEKMKGEVEYKEMEYLAGRCENCGEFSTELLYVNGKYLCPVCRGVG